MNPIGTTIRFTDEDLAVIDALAAHRKTTRHAVLVSIARDLKKGIEHLSVQLWPEDLAALAAYQADQDMDSLADAARAAMRVGLSVRGHLHYPANKSPDQHPL